MKRTLLISSFIFSLMPYGSAVAQDAPAFPGAEGHGRYVTGGRGGKVIHVTNLNDSGTGSFRKAVSGNDKKIVVFDVGGVIALNSDVNIGANTTIEGQTAPWPGITLRYYTVNFSGNNVIVRFLRSRRGEERNVNDGADAIWTRQKTGIMLDHCSFSWSIDEVASFYDNNNFTMQWCTIGESLVNAGHQKGAHGYGGIWGGKLASFHHNLICHVKNRSPRFNGARYDWKGYTGNQLYAEYQWENAVQAENVDFRNCVVYNCGNGCYGGPGGGQINIVNNYYKSGPASKTSRVTNISVGNSGNSDDYPIYWGMTSRYFINGNQVNTTANYDWRSIAYDSGVKELGSERYSTDPNHYYGENVSYTKIDGTDCVRIRLDEPAPTGTVTTHTAAKAFDKVLTYAGASLLRDDVDDRYAFEAREGSATYTGSVTETPGWIDHVADVEGYTEKNFGTGKRPTGFDNDKDGMADAWERANGLNPDDASDALTKTLDPVGFYTNIEVYCNSLVQDIMLEENADAKEAVADYYPAFSTEDGSAVAAINQPETPQTETVEYSLSQSTNMGNNTSSTYFFDGGVTISNGKSKNYAAGKDNGVKYSAGVQYTITLPAGVQITQASFIGYDNYDGTDAWLGEVAGVEYDDDKFVFPMKNGDTYTSVVNTVDFDTPVSGQLTFTPQGKQVVLVIRLTGFKGDNGNAVNVVRVSNATADRTTYNILGQRCSPSYRGIVISGGRKRFVK